MTKQPYFFLRQFVCIIIEIIILFAFVLMDVDVIFRFMCELTLLITISETFMPYILMRFRFIEAIDALFYYFPFYYHIIYIEQFEIHTHYKMPIILVIVCATILLLLINFKDYKKAIVMGSIKHPLSKSKFISILLSYLMALVSEEIVFRMMILNISIGFNRIVAVLISTTLFTFSHYINRWANVIYKIKNYIYIFLLGVLLALLYIYTKSLFLCIIVHMIYNSSDYIILVKRLLKKEELLFDDY